MAGITLVAELPELDRKIFKQVVDKFMQMEMVRAVKEFLKAALVRIPKRTGFLRGSFTDVVKYFNVEGTGAGSGGYYSGREFYYESPATKFLKTPVSGIKYVTDPKSVLRKTSSGIVFEIDSNIRYFRINDFAANSRVSGTPWNAIKDGYAAALNWLEGAPGRFPAIESILTKVEIRTTGTSTSSKRVTPDIESIIATRELLIQGFD